MNNPFGNVPSKSSNSAPKIYINLIQKSTEKDIKGGKPGKLYRSDTLEAADSITGAVTFITRKRVNRNDEGTRCYSPDAVIGKGKAGVHGINEAFRSCDTCEYKQKEKMGKSPCMIYWWVVLNTPEGEEFVLEFRRSSYMVGNDIFSIVTSGDGMPWEKQIKISGKKVSNYFTFDVEEAGATDPNQVASLTARNKELKEEYDSSLYQLEARVTETKEETVSLESDSDVPF